MPVPFAADGKSWGRQADRLEDMCKILKNRENGDVMLWLFAQDETYMQFNMSRRAAVRFALTILKAAMDTEINMDGIYVHICKNILKEEP